MTNDISAEVDKQLRHNLNSQGMAQDVVLEPTNSETFEAALIPEQKKEKHRLAERLLELQKWLDNYLCDLEEQIENLNIKIEAGHALLDLYKSGERNFDTPEY